MKNVVNNDCIMIGCDLHENSMLLAIATGTKQPTFKKVVNDKESRNKLIEMLKVESEKTGADVFLVYEACGLGFTLYDAMLEAGFNCAVLAPSKIAKSSKSKGNKTDKRDAELLLSILRGHLLAGNELPAAWVPDDETRDDRLIVRMRLNVAEKLAQCKQQIASLLKQVGIKRPEANGENWSNADRAWLQGQVQNSSQFGFRQALGSLLRQIDYYEQEVAELDESVKALAETERYCEATQEVTKMKGVGLLTAMVFLAEIGDLTRFKNRRQIASYLGLVPKANESGEAADRKSHITRHGPSRVRKVLNQAAWNAARFDPMMKIRYDGIVKRNPKKKKIAVVAIMRHLAIWMWHRAGEAQLRISEANGHSGSAS